jgi:hypothetical protein
MWGAMPWPGCFAVECLSLLLVNGCTTIAILQLLRQSMVYTPVTAVSYNNKHGLEGMV